MNKEKKKPVRRPITVTIRADLYLQLKTEAERRGMHIGRLFEEKLQRENTNTK